MEDGNRTEGNGSSREPDSFAGRSVRRRDGYPLPGDFDRISDLPDSIIIEILSLLPFSDVIATATLSKRWLFLWKMVPNLVFSASDQNRTSKMVSFIDKVLLLHDCPRINKFSVEFEYRSEFQSALDKWLQVVTGKNVEEINLGLHTRDVFNHYTLPQHLYKSSSLVKLTLTNCSIIPSSVVYWPSLKSLSMEDRYLGLDDPSIKSILSGSPALEFLELHQCIGLVRLNITSASLKKLVINSSTMLEVSAPRVESLIILGLRFMDHISLKLPSLLRATLNFELRAWPDDFKTSCRMSKRLMTTLLKTLNSVEELTLGTWCIQVLSLMEMQKLTAPMSNCKGLILNTSSDRWNYPGIANLLRNSGSLETLVITMNPPCCKESVPGWERSFRKIFNRNGKLSDKNYWNSQEESLVDSLSLLKAVKIIDNYIIQSQIEVLLGFLQVILKNARVLEKLVICTNKEANYKKSLNSMEVTRRLLSFPRASTSVVILYYKC